MGGAVPTLLRLDLPRMGTSVATSPAFPLRRAAILAAASAVNDSGGGEMLFWEEEEVLESRGACGLGGATPTDRLLPRPAVARRALGTVAPSVVSRAEGGEGEAESPSSESLCGEGACLKGTGGAMPTLARLARFFPPRSATGASNGASLTASDREDWVCRNRPEETDLLILGRSPRAELGPEEGARLPRGRGATVGGV